MHDLKAYPQYMDVNRPVRSLKDLSRYSSTEPLYRFFLSKGIKSQLPVSYVLEVNRGWFKEHGVVLGDRFYFDEARGIGWFESQDLY